MSTVAVMVHVADGEAGLRWYQQVFPSATRNSISETFFEYLDIDGIWIEIGPADEKVASGAEGSVVYWHVDDFHSELRHMHSIGATLYRGPANIEDGNRMCQVRDPLGNCIGLRG